MSPARAVILDVDGTLVDSNDAHTAAWIDAIKEAGHDAAFEKVRRLIGMGGDKLLPEAIGLEKDSPEGEKIAERRKEIFKTRYLPNLAAFPDTEKLLRRMHETGLKLVVASSAEADELETLLEIAGATDLVEERTSSSDAKNSKPDPDIVQVALKSADVDMADAIMLGDTPYDIEAATKAGVRLVAVRCGGWDDADLKGAIAVYDAPADLLAHYDTSPFARGQFVGG